MLVSEWTVCVPSWAWGRWIRRWSRWIGWRPSVSFRTVRHQLCFSGYRLSWWMHSSRQRQMLCWQLLHWNIGTKKPEKRKSEPNLHIFVRVQVIRNFFGRYGSPDCQISWMVEKVEYWCAESHNNQTHLNGGVDFADHRWVHLSRRNWKVQILF